MKLLQTTNIEKFPEDIIIGFSEIRSDLSEQVLSPKEYKEWCLFTNEGRKREYLTARTLFKEMLNKAPLSNDFKLSKYQSGKPFAKKGDSLLNVSFSHTQNAVFCALSLTHDIGIDAEHLSRSINSKIVERILNKEERDQFKTELPIVLWTVKEATVKSLGTGLRTNLNELCIVEKDEPFFSLKFNNEITFQICSFQEMNHQLSIAYPALSYS